LIIEKIIEMSIHREGYKILAITVAILVGLNGAGSYFFPGNVWVMYGLSIASIIFFLLILQFFRSPSRVILHNEKQVIAPADGKVVVIEETLEPEYFQSRRIQISIFMSPLNVHINRNPVSGVVSYFRYHAGKYLVAWHPKSSTENERTTLVVRMKGGVEVLLRQIAGAMAKRIRWYIAEGQAVEQGNEFGFITFGSRVDVFLPPGTEICVKIGDKTVGGKTVLAELA
jgi:phosphatidylserine decarboxylase